MRGLHLTADLYDCRCDMRWLADAAALGPWCRQAAAAQGLEGGQDAVAAPAADGSISVALLLPGSHVCLHTWPAERAVTIDVYLSHRSGDLSALARNLMDALLQRFAPAWTEQRSLDRGDGA
jgi:S-adenosylmethionine decarboxylase